MESIFALMPNSRMGNRSVGYPNIAVAEMVEPSLTLTSNSGASVVSIADIQTFGIESCELGIDIFDQVGVVRSVLIQPKDHRCSAKFRASYASFNR